MALLGRYSKYSRLAGLRQAPSAGIPTSFVREPINGKPITL